MKLNEIARNRTKIQYASFHWLNLHSKVKMHGKPWNTGSIPQNAYIIDPDGTIKHNPEIEDILFFGPIRSNWDKIQYNDDAVSKAVKLDCRTPIPDFIKEPIDSVTFKACLLEIADIPNVNMLYFTACHFTKLTGIQKLSNIKYIGSDNCIIDGGVLSLLKLPNLAQLEVYNGLQKDISATASALRIVAKHIKDKDIPECQQELIEEGLQEFAKL